MLPACGQLAGKAIDMLSTLHETDAPAGETDYHHSLTDTKAVLILTRPRLPLVYAPWRNPFMNEVTVLLAIV